MFERNHFVIAKELLDQSSAFSGVGKVRQVNEGDKKVTLTVSFFRSFDRPDADDITIDADLCVCRITWRKPRAREMSGKHRV